MLAESSSSCSNARRSIFASAVAIFTLAIFAAPSMAQEIVSPSNCAGTFNPTLSCTSNDIAINLVEQMTEGQGGQAPITTCNQGDTGFLDIALTTQLNAQARYDVLTWYGTEGNDPREATAGNCYVSSLPDDPASAFILDLEAGADACLDVNDTETPVVQYMFQVPFTCIDEKSLDGGGNVVEAPDGEVDVFALVTWFQNNTLTCGTGDGETMEPGLNPKCDIALLTGLNVQVVLNPDIAIVKSPATQEIVVGETADFTLTVTNEGDVDLTGVVVTDPLCDAAPVLQSGDVNTNSVLETTETWVYTCSIANITEGFTNTADVEAFDTETEQQVTDSDTSEVTTANPGIQITKTPATQQVSPGGTAAFTLTLINTGDEDLDTVEVTDLQCDAAPVRQSGDTDADEELDTDETWVYTCSTTNVQAEFTNTADVSAIPVPFDQPAVTDSDTAEVTLAIPTPAVGIVKSPVNQFVALGGTANFTLTVTNEGDVRLEDVLVTDPLCDASPQFQTGDDGADGVLGLDETWIYTCSTANVQASFTNTGNVSATPEFGGDDVTDSDTANVTVGTAPDVPIPTLGQWLLVFLAALLLGSGLLARRRVLGRK